MVQGLKLLLSSAGHAGSSLVRELRIHMSCATGQLKKKKRTITSVVRQPMEWRKIMQTIYLIGIDGKASVYNARDPGSIPGLGRFPWRRKWQSTPGLLSGKSHGQRSLVGYSPWGCKESDMTERLHYFHYINNI